MADIKDRVKNNIDSAADQAKQATDRAAAGAHDAQREGEGMVDRVKAGAHDVADRASEYAQRAGEAARDAGQRVQNWAGDTYDRGADQLQDFGDEMTRLVRKHPLPAVLIGFGVGLLIGRAARMV